MIARRSFLAGLASIFAAPAIVRISSLMPMRGMLMVQESAFLAAYRREMIEAFEFGNSFLRTSVTAEAVIRGNEAYFRVLRGDTAAA